VFGAYGPIVPVDCSGSPGGNNLSPAMPLSAYRLTGSGWADRPGLGRLAWLGGGDANNGITKEVLNSAWQP
jgi:hypothetical protein